MTTMIHTLTGQSAKDILTKKIEQGRASAAHVFEQVSKNAPRDSIAKGRALRFLDGDSLRVALRTDREPGDVDGMQIHKHALGQLAARAGVPGSYLAELANADGWRRTLAAEILSRHYNNGEASTRFLVRAVNGQVRGVLSDRYRRLDSRPLIDAFATECQKIGAVPVDGTASDTRFALKAIVPTVFEPVKGEAIAFGLEWANSDFGNGMHAVRAFILRLWCLNGATMENALAQVHLGRTLGDDIDLSQRTYELDTKTSISALRDIVAGTLAPKRIEALCAGIANANAQGIEWKNASSKLARRLLKGELEEARKAFESDDVVNLPAGKTMWRASNAISWLAGKSEDPDRKLELERLAGEIVNGRKDAETDAELVN